MSKAVKVVALALVVAAATALSCSSGKSSSAPPSLDGSQTNDAGNPKGDGSGTMGRSGSGSGGAGSSSGSGSAGSGGSGSDAGESSGSGSGDAGSPTDSGPGEDAFVAINPNAFYVATNGSESNPGTFASPFASLAQAQTAMRASTTIKTTYVRAGTYKLTATGGNCLWGNSAGSAVALSSADDGETWSFYPPDGYGSAILDGQSTAGNTGGTGGNGVGCGFGASEVSALSVIGLQFENFLYAGVWGYACPLARLLDNEVHDTTAAADSAGGLMLVASPAATIAHNYVHDVAYMGIMVQDNSADAGGLSNVTVSGNVVLDPCGWPAVLDGGGNDQNGGDCGGIYFWSQHPSTSTNIVIEHNLVRDINVSSHGAGDFGGCCAQGIYLDDGTNNVSVTGNVVTGITSACFQIHGGQNNVIRGNLCDVGAAGTGAIVEYQNDMLTQMTGNVFEDNVVVAGSTGPGRGFVGDNGPPNPMTIKDNAYFNYVGTTVDSTSTGGAGTDSNPTYVDPDVSCWSPTLAGSSPVLNSPVSFPGIVGGWGPPGFVLPTSGTAPSWPHGC